MSFFAALGPILSGVAGIASAFSGSGGGETTQRLDLGRLRRQAEKHGFNPLTVLRNAPSGFMTTHSPTLSSAQTLARALSAGIQGFMRTGVEQATQQREEQLLGAQLELIRAQTNRIRSAPSIAGRVGPSSAGTPLQVGQPLPEPTLIGAVQPTGTGSGALSSRPNNQPVNNGPATPALMSRPNGGVLPPLMVRDPKRRAISDPNEPMYFRTDTNDIITYSGDSGEKLEEISEVTKFIHDVGVTSRHAQRDPDWFIDQTMDFLRGGVAIIDRVDERFNRWFTDGISVYEVPALPRARPNPEEKRQGIDRARFNPDFNIPW